MAEQEVRGPVMICATRVMKAEGIRIGRISRDITLPRTVRLVTAVSTLAGALVLVVLAALFGAAWNQLIYAAFIGGTVGYFITTFSPLRGETLATWVTLQILSARTSRRIDGRPVMLSVGVATAQRLPAGKVQLRRGAVKVAPGTVDERGVLLNSNVRQS